MSAAACTTASTPWTPRAAAPEPSGGVCGPLDAFSAEDEAFADTLLAEALDNEALFTISGALKPMSTVRQLRAATLRPDSTSTGEAGPVSVRVEDELRRLERMHRVVDMLDCGPLDFEVVPFRAVFDSLRNLSVVVVDRGLLDRTLRAYAGFFGHWGLTPGADPGVVVTMIEFEERYDRYRGYGILFGYPEYAVDFFVEAAREGDAAGELVPRDFIRMPVHSGREGRFVYAVPRGGLGVERAEDAVIREEAIAVLDGYAERRARYVDSAGRFRAFALYRDWIRERLRGEGGAGTR